MELVEIEIDEFVFLKYYDLGKYINSEVSLRYLARYKILYNIINLYNKYHLLINELRFLIARDIRKDLYNEIAVNIVIISDSITNLIEIYDDEFEDDEFILSQLINIYPIKWEIDDTNVKWEIDDTNDWTDFDNKLKELNKLLTKSIRILEEEEKYMKMMNY